MYVRAFKLVDDEEKADKVLEILNIPFFVEENDLKNLVKNNEDIEIKFVNNKLSKDKLRTKIALIEFKTKKELKNELRLIKYANENEKLYLYKSKVRCTRAKKKE